MGWDCIGGALIGGVLVGVLVAGFIGHSHTLWQLGGVEYKRAGKVAMLSVGRLRFAKIARTRWRKLPSAKPEGWVDREQQW